MIGAQIPRVIPEFFQAIQNPSELRDFQVGDTLTIYLHYPRADT